ncbi:GDP-mannose 4,6-dehydratase [Coraliomargarita akajimensis]|uniref:NAD-dependent epimerase/dehydratase n=1 Tax=Coraliomargarita akajimensis (strain DSM 45221 / IAM 15411 / JCM 23193 / KCTC 12865 / 04OKA010-24) TaxID=583355 RepID=D5EKV8_CORAD|nr:GDP-mannose 4,6-dehydratase [Coraliomargarita akajimensis]ADE55015.1 NAD-dependent epimerase/dehydratase [Coraliomargarita akajimensis DSM 45221]
MNILLTGCAGFIGSHTLDRLLAGGHNVIGIDNFDPFYDRSLKTANIATHFESADGGEKSVEGRGSFELVEGDLADPATYQKLKFIAEGFLSSSSETTAIDGIIHLAAKAGVRPSIEDPVGYQRANVIATQNLLEFARENQIKQFVFASSSSVYGVNPKVPWSEKDAVLLPISPYASTKVSCELMGHVYSHLYGIRVLGLRFFTVYGPRQRPDLAINKFVRLIEAGEPIPVFGDGSTRRDYTFIDDIVDGILGSLHYQGSNYEVVNLGNNQTVTLSEMIATIEDVVGKPAIIDRQPEQPGDVPQTWADVSRAKALFGYQPKTSFRDGIAAFYDWWRGDAKC